MLNTSIGHHTLSVFKELTHYEIKLLWKDIIAYSEAEGRIKIFPCDKVKNVFLITYTDYKGIGWKIRFCNKYPYYRGYYIEAVINPKHLLGISNNISVASENDIDEMIYLFNREAQGISPIIGELSSFSLKRIDYCINFDLQELGINCSDEQMIKLIKRANIPNHFKERTKYCIESHRQKSDDISFYLTNPSVVVNIYCKTKQLERKQPKTKQLVGKQPNSPDMDKASDVIRFEVQFKSKKIYPITRLLRESVGFDGIIHTMLSDDVAEKNICKYFAKVIMGGDYYTLSEAKRVIKSYKFRADKEARLINDLRFVNSCRGIYKAKCKLQKKRLISFNKSLTELTGIGINPVTIPQKFGVKYIHGLLRRFNEMM